MIVKVPGLNSMGKTKGCRNAGNFIVGNLKEKEKYELEEIHVPENNLEEQNKLIYKNSLEIFDEQDKVIFLGGDHSISYSIGKAFLDYCKKNDKKPCLIVFDAHADCCKPGKEPTHEEWLRGLVERGFPAKNILLVGVRKLWKEEEKFLKQKKIRIISIDNLSMSLEETTDLIMEFSGGKELYVSLDIDVVDPVFVSTVYKEPGGLSSREIIYILSRISKMKNLKCLDVVEVNSEEDKKQDNLTVKLAAKLVELVENG